MDRLQITSANAHQVQQQLIGFLAKKNFKLTQYRNSMLEKVIADTRLADQPDPISVEPDQDPHTLRISLANNEAVILALSYFYTLKIVAHTHTVTISSMVMVQHPTLIYEFTILA